jgi:HK97 family phage portal protein
MYRVPNHPLGRVEPYFEQKAAPPAFSSNLAYPDAMLAEIFGALPTAAGRTITPEIAMQVPAVACAVQAISNTIATLPVKTYVRLAEGGKEPDPAHPSYGLVHDDASEWWSSFECRRQITVDALLHGAGFAFVNRVDGRPYELIRLDPKRTRVDMASGEPVYRYAEGAGERAFGFRDVLHIPALSIDGVTGKAPIKIGREAIALAAVLAEHTAHLFGRGARPNGTIETAKALTPEAVAKIRRLIETQHSGPENSSRTIILPDGFQFRPLTLSSVDAQLLELLQFAVVEIARVFRVPPVLLMDYGRATWSNSEDMGRQFLE